MSKHAAVTPWQKAIIILTYAVMMALIVAALYWAQVVFIPLALAIFLAFLLNPLVRRLEKRGLHRVWASILAVLIPTVVLGGIIWIVGRQVTSLAHDLPTYSENIKAKVKSLRQLGAGSVTESLEKLISELDEDIKREQPTKKTGRDEPLVVKPPTPSWFSWISGYLSSTLVWLGGLALVLVLLLFLLLNHEDMRNRVFALAGEKRLSFTTQAMAEADQRISRYLLMQVIINVTYGLTLAAGLFVIGIDYALLWGFLAAVMRYAPYIGPWIGALFPITLSLAMFDNWWVPLTVIGFILVLELVSNNFMEPWLYGQTIGVSEVGLLMCAAFWTFLWGPIGLVLSAPLTVCLVVLGKYVGSLRFIYILLGDKPVLSPSVRFYQRLLARDVEEAKKIVKGRLEKSDPDQLYDELYVPALHRACAARKAGDISEADEDAVIETIREFLKEMHAGPGLSPEPVAHPGPIEPTSDEPKVRAIACAARNREDELPLAMLRTLLDPQRWEMDTLNSDTLTGEAIDKVEENEASAILIGCVPPGITHARYLCKRLRSQFPDIKIIVGYWGVANKNGRVRKLLEEAGADEVVSLLTEARDQFNSLAPVLSEEAAAKNGTQKRAQKPSPVKPR